MPDSEFEGRPDFYSDGHLEDVRVHAKLDHHTNMLGGMASVGRVVKATKEDQAKPDDIPRVLVQVGGVSKGSYVRNWMPWTTARAGYDGEWWTPELDEQVLVISPSGNLTQAIIVGSLYRGALTFDSGSDVGSIKARDATPNAANAHIHKRIYKDGTSVAYDRNSHELSIDVKSTPESTNKTSVKINANKSIVLTAGTTRITVTQDGAVDIAAQGNDITIAGNIKVTGTMDVS